MNSLQEMKRNIDETISQQTKRQRTQPVEPQELGGGAADAQKKDLQKGDS